MLGDVDVVAVDAVPFVVVVVAAGRMEPATNVGIAVEVLVVVQYYDYC